MPSHVGASKTPPLDRSARALVHHTRRHLHWAGVGPCAFGSSQQSGSVRTLRMSAKRSFLSARWSSHFASGVSAPVRSSILAFMYWFRDLGSPIARLMGWTSWRFVTWASACQHLGLIHCWAMPSLSCFCCTCCGRRRYRFGRWPEEHQGCCPHIEAGYV